MGRDVALLIASFVAGCGGPATPPRMSDRRVLEVAVACAREKHDGRGVAGCLLRLDSAELDELPGGAFRVTFQESRCKPAFERGRVLEIDAGGTCTKLK